MERVLMLASVASMIEQFNMPNIELLQEMGYAVDVACNFEQGSTCSDECVNDLKKRLNDMNVRCFQIDFSRSATHFKEHKVAYKQVKKLLQENQYHFLHCHSPIGGVIGRLAGHNSNTKVMYTAHGFHFFKGAPLLNWLLFFPIEWLCAFYTDVLITINHEDYQRAKKYFHAKTVQYIPGVGVHTEKYRAKIKSRSDIRKSLGLDENDVMLLSVGELCENKNHSTAIKALEKVKRNNCKYYICGKGALDRQLEELAKHLNLEKQVFLLGYRQDIPELCKAADIFIFLSRREGLGLAAIEGMAAGLPIITSNVHGINDYSKDGITGYSYSPDDVNGIAEGLNKCIGDSQWRHEVGSHNQEAAKAFDIIEVQKIMKKIYAEI